MNDIVENLLFQAILSSQARGEDPTDAAVSAVEAYFAGQAAFKLTLPAGDPNAAYLQAAAEAQRALAKRTANCQQEEH